ncbi:MAG TPA: HAD-IC family P-type ATPase [Thermomicrobiales bacterium]
MDQTYPLAGLTETDVRERRARGEGHRVKREASRTYAQIVRDNLVALINIALFAIGITLLVLGRYSDAIISAGLVLINVGVGMVQEIRAKRRLDQIALLTRPKATVRRDGTDRQVDPGEIVRGDVLRVGPGDQIVVDGHLVGDGRIEVDESLLTGETDLIPKQTGDEVHSGSFCVSGTAYYLAEKVGEESLAAGITAGARAFRRVLTPLQREVNLMLRVLLLMTGFFGLLIALASIIHDFPFTDAVLAGAVIVGLVPPGLFLMITIAYAIAAIRLAKMDALIQQANAVESLSNVDVLCLDKTGTLTANRIKLDQIHPLGIAEDDLKQALSDFAASASTLNKTSEAIAAALPGERRTVHEEIPFSSAWKWSALALDDPARRGVYVLGAPEMLRPALQPNPEADATLQDWADRGLRVLLFARSPELAPLRDTAGNPALPPQLIPLAVLGFTDELRPNCKETLDGFAEAGIRLKIISGDNPETVAALARQAGLARDAGLVSGLDLAAMDEAQFTQAAAQTTVFGRITPQQKERLVDTLRQRGHYVAMIGDGVNDVLSLKKANLGIAMQSGSQATRAVADIVLLNDSFAALPAAFQEGQRIRNGMQDILKLFLTRVFAVAMILIAVIAIQAGFPFTPKQIGILSTLTVGIPAFALAAWSRVGVSSQHGLVRSLLHFVVPAATTMALLALAVYIYYYNGAKNDLPTTDQGPTLALTEDESAAPTATTLARDATTTTLILCGLFVIVFAEPPTPFWTGGDELSGDRRPTILALGMLIAYVAILASPFLRDFFGLHLLGFWDYVGIVILVIVWAAALRAIWRARLFDRFLGVQLG